MPLQWPFEQKENPTKRGVFPCRHREDKKVPAIIGETKL